MITENLGVFLQDFGVPCSCNAYGFTGVLDAPDEALAMAGVSVLSTMYSLLLKTSDVTACAIASGSAVTVNGVVYAVRDVLSQDDGAFSRLTLSK